MFKIAVFASGGGSNFQCLIDKKKSKDLNIEFAFLLVNNSSCGAVQRAQKNEIPVLHMSSITHPDEENFNQCLLSQLEKNDVELIVLAGYMKKIPAIIMERFANRIVNIHPSLLPAFGGPGCYGMNVHRAVFERGVKFSGVTIHFVSGGYDSGPIILQDMVTLGPDEGPAEIAAKVLVKEHDSYWRVIKAISENTLIKKGEHFWLPEN